MIASDPRRRAPVLLAGQDAMDVDEAIPATTTTTETAALPESNKLIDKIITPAPVATSSRFRNALARITTNPASDVEAWQALMTEVNATYTSIPSVHAVDAETHAKLDWVESCYGALLTHFPYAVSYYTQICEMLLTQSARVGEEGGPAVDYGMDTSRRALKCQQKVDALLHTLLRVDDDDNDDNTSTAQDVVQGMCSWSVDLWLLYIRKATRDATRKAAATLPTLDERAAFVRQATQQAYDTAVKHAAGAHQNHELWKAYVQYVRDGGDQNNTSQQQQQQRMLHLRSVYQRAVVHPMTGLDQLWQEYEAFERSQNEALAAALTAELAPKYQHARSVYLERNRVLNVDALQLGRLATPPVDMKDDDYSSKMREEQDLLTTWKTRCAYERTNPERLTPTGLAHKIRQVFQEMACVLTRHPECWNMWSTWELLLAAGSERAARAICVLQLGQEHIPDCTLLAWAEAQVVEQHGEHPAESVAVMERFLERSPNTLGFILYQRSVRQYKGMDEARAVFSRARRTLVDSSSASGAGGTAEDETKVEDKTEADATAPKEGEEAAAAGNKEEANNTKRWIVTNRLDPAISGQQHQAKAVEPTGQAGPITWHLYASHAMMEHRLNRSPQIAARVYELGLRKHASFLTRPQYIMRYAQLLFELNDTVNLRALLTRAVAACQAKEMQGALAAIWDMNLYFESLMSSSNRASTLAAIEAKRREALMGPDVEDVATGGLVGGAETALIGAQKSSIAEQLVRAEGYNISSNIVNGMSRIVDMFSVMGIWGNDDMSMASRARRRRKEYDDDEKANDISGGKSDASYQNRLAFADMLASGTSGETEGALGSKILTARERLQQGTGAVGAGQSSAMMLAIQQSAEWLRPLLLMLPASRLRLPIVAKPPPHLTEMALTALRQNALPSERPADSTTGKRSRTNGEDTDDENGGKTGSGGYGNQFRARQRLRQQKGMTEM